MIIELFLLVYKLLNDNSIQLAKVIFFLKEKRYFLRCNENNLQRFLFLNIRYYLHIFLYELPVDKLPEFVEVGES